jgi:hypothetical protein
MNVLTRTLKAAWDEANKPLGYVKGDEFEQYVRAVIFPKEHYDVLEKTHDYRENKEDYIASSQKPDYLFKSKASGLEFYVEAKFRSRFQNQVLEWCKLFQLKRYHEVDLTIPVFIVIGLGGQASIPEKVFLIPVRHIKFIRLYPGFLQKYEIRPDRSVSESILKRILD